MEDFKIKSKIIIFCLILCLIFSITGVSASDVNTTDNQVLSATPDIDTLSASVNTEQNNNTQSVSENNLLSAGNDDSGTDSAYANGLTIAKSIIIDGNGHSISGNAITQLLNIQTDNVVLKNLNFKNLDNTLTRIINIDSENIQMINCNFTNITTSSPSLNIERRNFNIINCTFNNINPTGSYDAFYWIGEKGLISDSTFINIDRIFFNDLKIFNSTFENYTGQCFYHNMGGILNLSDCNFTNLHGAILTATFRPQLYIDHIRVFNTTATSSSLFNTKEYYTVKNSIFEENSVNYICRGGSMIDNCTFISNNISGAAFDSLSSNSGSYPGVLINNSRFINNTGILFYPHATDFTVKNTNITNNTLYNIKDNGYQGFTIDHCNFIDNKVVGDSIFTFNGNKTKIIDSKFINNMGFTTSAVVKNAGSMYLNNTTFSNNINSMGEDSGLTDKVHISYNPIDYLYVAPEATGDGSGKDPSNRCTLSEALSLIDYGGTLFLASGTYNDVTKRLSLYANIVGEDEKKVIINNGSFIMYLHEGYIKYVTFNNSIATGVNNAIIHFATTSVSIINCTFENITTSGHIVGCPSDYSVAHKAINITVNKCGGYAFFGSFHTSGYKWYLGFQLENITITDSDFNRVIVIGPSTNNLFKNWTFTHTNFVYGIMSSSVGGSAAGSDAVNQYSKYILVTIILQILKLLIELLVILMNYSDYILIQILIILLLII